MISKIEVLDIFDLKEYENNANEHPAEQIEEIAASIVEFGYNDPLSVDENNMLLTGHGTNKALRLLVERGLTQYQNVTCVVLSGLSERQKKAYILAHNRIARNSKWNFEKLSEEINALVEADFSIDLIGFDEQEIDSFLKIDESILPKETASPEPLEEDAEEKPKQKRAKSKILHTCPNCQTQFTA